MGREFLWFSDHTFCKRLKAVKNALKKWNKHQTLLFFLKISDGVWIFDRNDIGTCLSDHFQNYVYSSTIPSEEEIFCALPKLSP